MKKIIYCLILLLAVQCRERYNVPFVGAPPAMLVVDGTILYGGETMIRLSRTGLLSERVIVPEEHAQVQVEGDDNAVFALAEQDSGRYKATVPVNPDVQYRLRIKTDNNKEYLSDFRTVIQTPDIDSIVWKRNNGVQISVNTHDPVHGIQYYKWDYEETWEFRSKYEAKGYYGIEDYNNGYFGNIVKIIYPPLGLDFDSSRLICWKSQNSSNIAISSTSKLSENVIFERPLIYYPENSWPLNFLYSVRVKQYGLSKEAYEFYQLLQKNTESMGSTFDPQPSVITGNVHCVTDPSEPVIGFIETASMKDKRIFIQVNELPGWFYDAGICDEKEFSNDGVNVDKAMAEDLLPTTVIVAEQPVGSGIFKVFSFIAADRFCVDCRLRGSSQRPSFWR